MKKKILVVLTTVVCAILLVVGSIAGTMAYLTSEAEVTNTFTVGSVTIDMDETDVTVYGEKESETRVKENTYKLIPGHTYIKDPTITVKANSEKCYLFVKVENELNDAATFKIDDDAFTKNWTLVDGESDVYCYTAVTDNIVTSSTDDQKIVVFNKMVINNVDISGLADKTVKVTAYAVQADGFTDAADAWDETFGRPTP